MSTIEPCAMAAASLPPAESSSQVYPFVFKRRLTWSAWCRLKLLPVKFVKLMRFALAGSAFEHFLNLEHCPSGSGRSSGSCRLLSAVLRLPQSCLKFCSSFAACEDLYGRSQNMENRGAPKAAKGTDGAHPLRTNLCHACINIFIVTSRKMCAKAGGNSVLAVRPQNVSNCVPKIYYGDLFSALTASSSVCSSVWARLEAYLFIHFLIYWCLSDPKRFDPTQSPRQLLPWLAGHLIENWAKKGT